MKSALALKSTIAKQAKVDDCRVKVDQNVVDQELSKERYDPSKNKLDYHCTESESEEEFPGRKKQAERLERQLARI